MYRKMSIILALVFIFCIIVASPLAAGEKPIKLGLIGLDTSHVIAFTKLINDPKNKYPCRVIAGYPGGSDDIKASYGRVKKYTRQLRDEMGVEIVDSIEELCTKVDGIMLESVDGRPHLKQVRPVIKARLPVYIDKPMAGSLADVLEIFRLARENNVPCWSSSSLRYSPGIIGMGNNPKLGKVVGCEAFGPCHLEKHHPDFYWYGVHGVEILFTIMGPGCQTVTRIHTDGTDMAVGIWKDGRIGSFRGLRAGKNDYGAMVFGEKAVMPSGRYEGYKYLVDEIVKFFQTGIVPVSPEETINIFAFMSAADESKRLGGCPVSIETVLEKARQENRRRYNRR